MSHTPGPWVVEKPRKGSPILMVVAEKGGMPGLIVNQGRVEPRDVANARLIAAAPDLLKAAQNLLEKLEFLGGCNEHDMDGPEELPEFETIRAAIAKAEGK